MLVALTKDLLDHLPGWTLRSVEDQAVVMGTLVLKDKDKVVDQFELQIDIDMSQPDSAPKVFEIGGRIPLSSERHINGDGSACLFVADEARKYWNADTSLSKYISGPVTSYFVAQSYFELTGDWIFGERPHELLGVLDFYLEELGVDNLLILEGLLTLAVKPVVKGHWLCPCGSCKKLRSCHGPSLANVRAIVPAERLEEVVGILKEVKKKMSAQK